MSKSFFYFVVIILVFSCKNEGSLFTNPSPKNTGVQFTNTINETDDLNILDYLYFYNGGGVSIGDINNDNLPDIYFSGNQVKNKLYLNKGNLIFEDISETAGVEGSSSWNTGAVMADVNGDGFMDIYSCAVVGINGFGGHNELFINNGDLTFTESANAYGLDFDSYSSAAAFLDYDLDGDLDIYLLNHAVHTQDSYGKADLRNKRTYESGDKLLRNDGNIFTDVSEEANIYGGVNGYGLGIAISDFNQDGWPDIYVGNDFHEDDYYYLNNGDGTFAEKSKEYFGHTSRFSMGNDVADINHDGYPDILSLDMLPEDETVLKSSAGDENVQTLKLKTEQFGYHYQYTRNMLQVNLGGNGYTETALLSGIAATDWSWSALFGDYDQDGEQDIFISNGIPKRPNDLDYIKFISNNQIKKKLENTKLVDQQAIEMMPSGAVHNYIFRGDGSLKYENKSDNWISKDTLISGATAIGDLDNDGDLDIVTNNINTPATIYINKTNETSNYLKIKFEYEKPNILGIGTKVFSYVNDHVQYKELYTARGFQASSEPIIHFGYGKIEKIDSLVVIWPDNTFQILKDINTNQTIKIKPESHRHPYKFNKPVAHKKIFHRVKNNLGINFTHTEDNYIDFNRQKLIPYKISDRGPAAAVGDINNDGKEDIFFGGAKYFTPTIYLQTDSMFLKKIIPIIKNDSLYEDISAVIKDFNNDGQNDLIVASGGGDYFNKAKGLVDRFYTQSDSMFRKVEFPELFETTSVIKPNDFDNDGDLDLFVGSNAVAYNFGKTPNSYLLKNDSGNFSIVENESIQNAGMVTDGVWSDFNDDGREDLILVGEWMSPKFFENVEGKLVESEVLKKKINGLWQAIEPYDIDNDGDIDYLLGNWGLNSKFKASEKFPMKMYYGDFDENKRSETIISIEKNGNYYPLLSYDELSDQLSTYIHKKFTSYKDFAGKNTAQIFEKTLLEKSIVLEVNTLESGYLLNENGEFIFKEFKEDLQVSPITAFVEFDFDKDSKNEVLAAGNYFGVQPLHSRFDGFSGALIKGENNIILGHEIGLNLLQKAVRHLDIIPYKKKTFLLVTLNNAKAEIYEID